jgi:hypothetical protein
LPRGGKRRKGPSQTCDLVHWYAEHHADDGDSLGPDAAVEIIVASSAEPT